MNKTYLNHDYLTDIITFDYSLGDVISGDLFISIERVAENASNFNEDFNTELNRVIAHGVLHLLGLKDKNKKDSLKMRMAEEEALILLKQLIVSE